MYKKMDKRYFILIPLIALIAIGIYSGDVFSLGHANRSPFYTVIGGSVEECNYCHDFETGVYDEPLPPNKNLRWVKRQIEWPPGSGILHDVNFTKLEDLSPEPDGTLADGNNAQLDGPCEVCHTQTAHHTNTGDVGTHYDGMNCTAACHPHFLTDIASYFEIRFSGTQSHYTHFDDPKGPLLSSGACFTACHKSPSNFSIFWDDKTLATTTVCDNCHSPGGLNGYNGVGYLGTCSSTTSLVCNEDSDCPEGETCVADPNSVAYGAKYNWEHGIYEPAVEPELWPSRVKTGKENWCAGCHDNGTSVINSISAPNVMGNNVTYGYNITGHGVQGYPPVTCFGPATLGCHNTLADHIDGKARTYEASLNNYQSSYRLADSMSIPRFMQYGPNAFQLCFNCHVPTDVSGPTSDFRNGDTNLHETHVGILYRNIYAWDSDWSGGACTPNSSVPMPGCDSAMSCTACHNVHGSPCLIGSSIVPCADPLKTPMIRHGELIGKVPALKFQWYDGNNNPTTDFYSSGGGSVKCSNLDVSYNDVCWGCHGISGEVIKYYRLITVQDVWTTDTSNNPLPDNTIHPGETIRYHVRFTVSGPNPPYYIRLEGVAQKVDGTGPKQTFSKAQYASLGTFEVAEDKTIPSGLTLPPEGVYARITITIGSYSYDEGDLLAEDARYAEFFVRPNP